MTTLKWTRSEFGFTETKCGAYKIAPGGLGFRLLKNRDDAPAVELGVVSFLSQREAKAAAQKDANS